MAVTSVDLDYSTDNGGSLRPVATGEANDGAYAWTVPNAPTTQALVRVMAHDAAANAGAGRQQRRLHHRVDHGVGDLPRRSSGRS